MWLRGLPPPEEPQEMLSSFPSSMYLWLAKKNQTLKMKRPLPQFPSILAIYCFCLLQIPSSGKGTPLPVDLSSKKDRERPLTFSVALEEGKLYSFTYAISTLSISDFSFVSNLSGRVDRGRYRSLLSKKVDFPFGTV